MQRKMTIAALLLPLLTAGCNTFQEMPSYFGYDSYWGMFCGCTQHRTEISPSTDEASDSLNKVYARVRNDFANNGEILEELEDSFRAQGFELKKELDAGGNTKRLIAIIDGDLSFPTGSSKLTPKALEIVDKIGQGLAEIPNTEAKVHGHTDTPGSYQGNKILSLKRAESVKQALITRKGIAPERIVEVRGFADDRKIIDTTASEPRNRRTEIWVSFKGE
ncbi:MAG: OmpA family protein [Leptospiraceae bacterium]|nr:OmpA family protein [Leptospiraceae bacterium]